MGRGLSDLQRFIVAEAGRRGRLYYADVLHHFFGLPPGRGPLRYHKPSDGVGQSGQPAFDPSSWAEGGQLASPGSQNFVPAQIGRQRYHSACASVSRACSRLRARGLVTCLQGAMSNWAGVELTDKGRELSVKLKESYRQVNR
jgi:hypothetical protein